jgi:plastocyanin
MFVGGMLLRWWIRRWFEQSRQSTILERKNIMKMKFSSFLAVTGALVMALFVAPHPGRSQETPASSVEVKIDNFTFAPQSVEVPLNTTVTWTNRDDIPHNLVSDDGLFKSKALDTDDKFSFRFSKAGTYQYFCGLHPKMVGKVVVH